MRVHFCEVCQKETEFQRLKTPVQTELRGTFLRENYESDDCIVCGTSYEPFENRNKNILNEYAAYREKVGYLQPEEIRGIRENYRLNIREFAAILGISYRTLAQIELGALQNAYQNMLFEWASSPKTMYKWVLRKKGKLAVSVEDAVNNLPTPEE